MKMPSILGNPDAGSPPPSISGMLLKAGSTWLLSRDVDDGMASTSTEGSMWVTIVDFIILVLTILGSLTILLSTMILEYKGRPSTTRMRLVQALILSDLILGIVGLVGSAYEISSNNLTAGTSTCDGLGFMLVVVLFTEHCWTLSLAVATYMILIYPLHSLTMLIERRWYYLWGVIWLISIAIGAIGLGVYGYFPSGGICYYGANAGLYAELLQFIPRAFVFVCITVLYARLFVFLRRPDRIRLSYSDAPGSTIGTEQKSKSSPEKSGGHANFIRRRKISELIKGRSTFTDRGKVPGVVATEEKVVANGNGNGNGALAEEDDRVGSRDFVAEGASNENTIKAGGVSRLSKGQLSPLEEEEGSPRCITPAPTPTGGEIPPWERVHLPAFEIDGQRYGGHSAHVSKDTSLWGNWKGLSGSKESRKRPSTGGSSHSHAPSRLRSASNRENLGDGTLNTPGGSRPNSPPSSPPLVHHHPRMDSIVSVTQDSHPMPAGFAFDRKRRSTELSTGSFGSHARGLSAERDKDKLRKASLLSSSPLTAEYYTVEGKTVSNGHLVYDPAERRDSSNGGAPSSSGKEENDLQDSRRSSASANTINQMGSGGMTKKSSQFTASSVPSSKTAVSAGGNRQSDAEKGVGASDAEDNGNSPDDGEDEDEDEEEDDDMLDLGRMLAEMDPPGERNRDSGAAKGGQGELETFEFVQESMASYLNRKTALLMLWFPLGYVLLFSVSLIRIVYDFVGSPPPGLRAVSRWFIFAQGILDAFIYGLVEWHTKRVVRKRVRKGTFSPTASGQHSALRNAVRAMKGGASRGPQSHSNANSATASRILMSTGSVPSPYAPTVTRMDDQRNIMEALEDDALRSRRDVRGENG